MIRHIIREAWERDPFEVIAAAVAAVLTVPVAWVCLVVWIVAVQS